MDYINEYKDLDVHLLKDLNEAFRLFAYTMIGFFVPFLLGHPQQLVGVLVNAALIVSALEAGSLKKCLPIALAPSLGVLSRGLIFGPFTPFLLYMIPFIWAGNLVLMVLVRSLKRQGGRNYWISLAAASLAKSGFLFSAALLLVSLAIVPPLFLTTMGMFQLWTALAGGGLAFALAKSRALSRLGF